MSVSPDDMSFLDRLGVLSSNLGKPLDQKLQPFGGAANLGLSLLANSGYSTTPRNIGQVLGTSALQSQQMASQRMNDDIKNQYMQAQIKALQAKPAGTTPSSVAEYEYAKANGFKGSFEEWQTKSKGAPDPSDVATYKYWQTLSPSQQQDMLRLKRNVGADYQVVDVNGVPTVVYKPAAGAVGGATTGAPLQTPLTNVAAQAAGKSQIAGAVAGAEDTAKKTADTAFDLPRVEQNVQQAIGTIDKLEKAPGLQYITGLYSKAPIVPGTDQAAADALAKQVEGQTFLQAYQALRGGGAITDIEGQKGTAAVARLQRAQSTRDYKAALKDAREIFQAGLDRLKKQTGKETPSSVRKTVGGKTYVQQNGQWYEDDGT
jgi:hypothetical protein